MEKIRAVKYKKTKNVDRTKLYEVMENCNISIKEKQQKDDSVDQVTLEFILKDDEIGYFAHEYRPENVPEDGAKLIDITAAIVSPAKKCIKWHLYDMKGTLAIDYTVKKLYQQWNAGLRHLHQGILEQLPEYTKTPDLGILARNYDEEKMKQIRDVYQQKCDEIENSSQNMTLAQRKDRMNIAKYRGMRKAAQGILDRRFQAENGIDTYDIHIKLLRQENEQLYSMRFPV